MKYQWARFFKKPLPLLALFLLIIITGISVYVVSYYQSTHQPTPSEAAGNTCVGRPIHVFVSKNGDPNTKSVSITVDSGVYRYYLHVYDWDTNEPCAGVFDTININGQTAPFGNYHSGYDGVARIDLPKTIGDGNYSVRYRPRGSSVSISWSPETTVVVNNSRPVSLPTSNMSDYIIYNPGDTYIYQNYDATGSLSGKTRLQIEEMRTVCGVRVAPWRFTKDDVKAYWRIGFNQDLRWMIVDKNYQAGTGITSGLSHFNDYIWGLRDKRYWRNTTNPIRDVGVSSENSFFYGTSVGRVPGYNLAPKVPTIPFVDNAQGESNLFSIPDATCPANMKVPATNSSSWKVRVEKEVAPVQTPSGTYNDVIRLDHFEGVGILETQDLLRESWYFAKGVGLIQILAKTFNNYGGNGSPTCLNDIDCLNDSMKSPMSKVVLQTYYKAQQISVGVSVNGSTFVSTITTTQSNGYYVKTTPSYTGYIEVRLYNNTTNVSGTPGKWLWAQDGIVRADTPNVPLGTYKMDMRIWAPNQLFDTETNIIDASIPWSNTVTVVLAQPTNTPSPTRAFTPTPLPTNTPTLVKSPTPIPTKSPTPSTFIPTKSPTPTPTKSVTPVVTNTPTRIPTGSSTVTPQPSQTATATVTSTVTQAPVLGDCDGNRRVDGVDFVCWLNHYNQNVSGPSNGDFNNNGKVDGVDYTIWLFHYGK